MSNDLWVRIRSRNESAEAFTQVAKDANTAATAVETASTRASTALGRQSGALQVVGKSSAMAAMQQKNLLFQLNDIGVSLAGGANPLMVAAQQGGQLATIYGPEEGGLGRALKETGNIATGLASKFWPIGAAIAAVGVSLAAVTHEINRNQEVQVSMADVVSATWQTLTEGLVKAAEPVTNWAAGLWDSIAPGISNGVNNLIGSFDLAYRDTVAIWSGLPGAIGDVSYQAVNAVMGATRDLVNNNLQLVNDALTGLRAVAPWLPPVIMPMQGGDLANPFAGQASDLQQQLGQNKFDVMSTDYIGQLGDRARKIAEGNKDLEGIAKAADIAKKSIDDMGNASVSAASDMGKSLATGLDLFTSFAGETSGLLGQIFEGNKTAAIAGAVLDASAGIAKTLSAYPFPFNIGMAALHGAAAIAQINKIKSTSKTSTSVDTSVGGGSAAPVAAPAAGGGMGQGVNITLQGGYFSGQQVMGLLDQIQSALGMQGKQIAVTHINGAL